MELKRGDRVRHPQKPEWGLGEVVEDVSDEKIQVFFMGIGIKILSLKHASLIPVTGEDAYNPGLDNLRKGKSKKGKTYKNIEELKRRFLSQFPGGFSSPKYFNIERGYKLDANKLMNQLLKRSTFEHLLESRDYTELCKRALQVVNKTNLIFPNEKMALSDGLKPLPKQQLFAERLYELLYGKDNLEKRFNQFADFLIDIGAAKWTIATYFLFISDPKLHRFLKPTVTQDAADICAFELNYSSELNWLTYKSLLEFSNHLRKSIVDLNPEDMIDIQSFIWCIAQD